MQIKIATKLTCSSLLIILLMVCLSLYAVVVSQNSLRESVGSGSLFLAEELIKRIDYSVLMRLEVLQRYSLDTQLQQTVTASNGDFDRLDNPQEYIDRIDKEWIQYSKTGSYCGKDRR